MNYHVLPIESHGKKDEIVFRYFYLIKDRYKDLQIPTKQKTNLLKIKFVRQPFD